MSAPIGREFGGMPDHAKFIAQKAHELAAPK
jgi:hypothetical protein